MLRPGTHPWVIRAKNSESLFSETHSGPIEEMCFKCDDIYPVKISFYLKIGKMGFILRPPLTNNIISDTVLNFSDPWILLSKRMMHNSQGHY